MLNSFSLSVFSSGSTIRRIGLLTWVLLLVAPAVAAQQLPSSLDIGGQIRQRTQLDDKKDGFESDFDDFHELRTRLNAGFAPADRVTTFIQIQDTRNFGDGGSTLSPPNGTFDLHQAYFKVDDLFDTPFSVKAGRQKLVYGNQRLIGGVEWSNQARTFDGGVVSYDTEQATVDVFAARLPPRFSGNTTGEGSDNLLGVYSTWAVAEAQTLEVFAILDNNTRNVAGTNDETQLTRFTPGVTLRGSVSQASYQLEGAYQTGDRGGSTINAYLLSGDADYSFGVSGSPTVGAGYTRLSGDADSGLDTFDTLFATNHKFYGYMDFFLSIPNNAQNGLQDLRVKGSANLSEKIGVAAKVHHFVEEDAPSGRPVEAYGQEVDLTLSYQFADPLSVTVGASSFFPRDAFAPNGDTDYWGYVMTSVNL